MYLNSLIFGVLIFLAVSSYCQPLNKLQDDNDDKAPAVPNRPKLLTKRATKSSDDDSGVLGVFAAMRSAELEPKEKKSSKTKKEKTTKKPKIKSTKTSKSSKVKAGSAGSEIVLMRCGTAAGKGKECVDVDLPYNVKRTAVEMVKRKKKDEVPMRTWGGVSLFE